MPQFTIIIPTYNRCEVTKRAIDSVLAQSFTDYELILVNDGSSDDTAKLAEIYSGKLIYIEQPNRGVSAARNAGIDSANSPYIAFLDSDDQWLPSKLQAQHDFCKQFPNIRIHQTLETWNRGGKRVNPRQKHIKQSGNIFLPSLELCLISPSAVVIRRELFEEFGLFDEQLKACEDYDLWLRITAFEKVGLIDREHMIRYGGHEDQLSGLFWGMDRFRVYAITKLLAEAENRLPHQYKKAAGETAIRKAEILMAGAAKRYNNTLADYLRNIILRLRDEDYNNTDYQSLAEETFFQEQQHP